MTLGLTKINLSHSLPELFGAMGALPNEALEKIIHYVGIFNFEEEKQKDWFGVGYLLSDEKQWFASVHTLRSLSLTNKTFAILTTEQLHRARGYHQRLTAHKREKERFQQIEREFQEEEIKRREEAERRRKNPFYEQDVLKKALDACFSKPLVDYGFGGQGSGSGGCGGGKPPELLFKNFAKIKHFLTPTWKIETKPLNISHRVLESRICVIFKEFDMMPFSKQTKPLTPISQIFQKILQLIKNICLQSLAWIGKCSRATQYIRPSA